jgi:hypothetical protein
VDLYQGDRLIRTFDASRSATQQWWHVFEISANGELIVVDRYSDGPPDFAFSVGTTIPEKTAK